MLLISLLILIYSLPPSPETSIRQKTELSVSLYASSVYTFTLFLPKLKIQQILANIPNKDFYKLSTPYKNK